MPENEIPDKHKRPDPGHWLPEDHRIHQKWLEDVAAKVEEAKKPRHLVIDEFQQLIEGNTRLYLLCTQMFDEIPGRPPYNKDPSGKRVIRGYPHMLEILNYLLDCPPSWSDMDEKIGLIGKPIYALFDWSMGTVSGYAFFLDPHVNAMLKKILNVWGNFLDSADSASCLDDSNSGWFGPTGSKELVTTGNLNNMTSYSFAELYQCDPKAPRYGYKSWDKFFTREFNWDKRPVAAPEDQDVIVNACESQPYRIAHDISRRDKFWTKGMPYSVQDMLNHDETTDQFVGGTIYQAFLSALSYHRWHSPVDGTIKKVVQVPGTYYSEPLFEDFGRSDPNNDEGAYLAGTSVAQAYLTAVATRALIFIEADNPAIGLCCVIQVGMSDVSSAEVTVEEGAKVKKGEQIGMFHFGGSTWILMLRKGVKVQGFPDPEVVNDRNWPVRSQLAKIVR